MFERDPCHRMGRDNTTSINALNLNISAKSYFGNLRQQVLHGFE